MYSSEESREQKADKTFATCDSLKLCLQVKPKDQVVFQIHKLHSIKIRETNGMRKGISGDAKEEGKWFS